MKGRVRGREGEREIGIGRERGVTGEREERAEKGTERGREEVTETETEKEMVEERMEGGKGNLVREKGIEEEKEVEMTVEIPMRESLHLLPPTAHPLQRGIISVTVII